MIELTDFPKIHCPFIRKTYTVNKEQWVEYGHSLQLRQPEAYLVTDNITPGYEWVFEDKDTICVEKLDGTNVKLLTKDGRLEALYNRKNLIDPLQIIKGKTFIIEGIFMSIQKGYVDEDGEQCGEVIGPKLQANPYELQTHLWYPFTKAVKHLKYKSFHLHDRTFDNWSSWFKHRLYSLFHMKRQPMGSKHRVFAAGGIFYTLNRKEEGKTYMAKLRRGMHEWYYSDKIGIYGYNPKG